jgi:hypothetical protein
MKRNLYSGPWSPSGVEYSSICAGRFVPVLLSSHMVTGASWE